MTTSIERLYYENPELWEPQRYEGLQVQRARLGIQWLPPDVASILDVGCGNGVLTNLLQHSSCVVGVDRSLTALRWLQASPCQADVVALPFQDDSFDTVISTEVIEHLPYKVFTAALAEIVRVARRYILITVPYCEALNNGRVRCPECGCQFHAHYHMRYFDAHDMENLFSAWEHIKLTRAEGIFTVKTPAFPKAWHGLRSLRSVMRGQAPFPSHTICPQCGYSASNIPDDELNRRRSHNILGSLSYAVWPKRTTHRWWMALYTKQ